MVCQRTLRRLFVGLGLAVFLPLVAGCAEPPAAVAPSPPKVTVEPPELRPLTDYAEYNGWVDAAKAVEVRSRVRGHIQKVRFSDGDLVDKDQVLFELDPRPFQAEVDRANEQIKVYEAQREAATKEEARLRELLGKGGASRSQVEKAEADTKSLDAQIAASTEEVKRRMLDLEYAHVKAEISGKVGRAMLQAGDLVNAGGSDPLLTTVVAVHPVRVFFNVDERVLQQFSKNSGAAGKNPTELLASIRNAKSPFTFALDGQTDFAHRGELQFADNQIDSSTGTLQIYGLVNNDDGKLFPGARVRVRLPIGKEYKAVLVPETAILADQDKRFVLVADAENMVRRRNVVLGKLTDDGKRAILAESPSSDDPPEHWRVLIDNLQRARINYPIDPQQRAGSSGPSASPVNKTGK
jgi:RND family efflux transporter MFP subunit